MILSLKRTCAAILMGICSIVYGNEIQNQDILDQICQYAQVSIERIEDEMIFLRPEYICIDKGQIFIAGDSGDAIVLPYIYSTGNELYLAKHERKRI